MEKSERVFKDFLSFCRDITGNDTIVLQVIQNRYNHTNPHYLFSDKFCDLVKSCTEKMQQDPTNKFVYIKDFATELKTYKAKPMKHLIRESTNDDAEGRRSPKRSKLDPGEHTGSPSKKSNLCRLIPLNTPTKVNDKSVDDCSEMPSTSATTCDVLDIDELSDKPLEQPMGSPYPLKKAKVVLETIVLSPAHLKSMAAMKKDLLEEDSKSMVSPRKKIDKEKLETVMKLRDKSIRGSEAQINRLELLLKKISDRIKKLEERELSLEDMEKEDTSYVLCDRYKAKFVKVWNKLCNINGRPNTTGRDTEKPFKYEETKYPEINKAVSQFVNKYQLFPDFQDVHEIIVKCNTRYDLQIKKRTIESLAQETFIMVGDMLQKRRMKDYASNFGCHLMDNIKVNDDPALVDAELRKKLEANKKTSQQNLEKVISKFAHLEAEHGDSTDDDEDNDTGDDDSKKEHGVSSDYDMNSQEEDGFLSQTEQKLLSSTELETDLQEKLVESDRSMETSEDRQVLPAADVEKSCEVPSSSGEVQGFSSCEEPGSGNDEKKGSLCGEISVSSVEDVEGSLGCEVPGSSNGEVKGSLSSEVKGSSSGEVPGCSSDEVQGSVHDEVSGSSSCEVEASSNAGETPGRLDAEALPGTTSESKKEGDVVCRTVDSLENVIDVSDNISEHSELSLMTNSRMNFEIIGTVILRDDVEKNLSEVSDPEVSIELTDESSPSCENRSEDSDVEPVNSTTCAPKAISCVPETIDSDASIELMDESFHSRGNADNSEIQIEERFDQNTSALDANLELQIENLLNCKNSNFEDRLNTFVNNILESDGHKASDKTDSQSVGIESNDLVIIESTDDFKEKSDSTVKHFTTGKSLRKREATKFQRIISQDVITCDDSLDNIIDLKSPEDLEIGQQKSVNKSADKTDFENVLKVDCDVQSPGAIIEMNRSHEIGPLKTGKRSGDKTDFENILKVGSGRCSLDIIEIDKTISDNLKNCSNVGKNLKDRRTLENISDADDCHLSPDVVEIDKSCSVLVDTVEDVILVDIPNNKSDHAINDVVQGCSKKCEDSNEVTVVCSPSSSMSLDNDLPLLPTASKENAMVEEPLSTIIQTSDNCATETGDSKEKTDEVTSVEDGNVQTSSLKVDVDTDDRSSQSSSTGISVISDTREELSSDSDSVVLDVELDSKVSKALGVKLDETLTNSIICLDQDDGSPKKPVSCAKPTSTDSEVNCAADEKVAFTVKSSNTVSPASISVSPASKSVKRSASPDDDSAVICLDDVSMDTDSNGVDDENDCIVLSPDKGAPARFRGDSILSQLMTKPLKPVAKRPKLPQSVPPHYNMSQFHRQLEQQCQRPRGFDHRTLQSSNNRPAGSRVVGEVVNCWSLLPPQPARHSMPVPRRSRKLFPAAIGSRMLQPASSTLPMLQSEDIFKISSDIVSKIFQNQSGKPPSDSDVIVCDDDSHSSSSISMLPQGFDDHLNLAQPFKLSPIGAHKRTVHRRPRGAGGFHSTPKVPARPPVQEDSVIMLE